MKIIGPFISGVAALLLAILALHNIVPTASAQATRVVTITDPVLNMQAYSLSIPANWIFDGAVIPRTSCNDGPFPVFRMMSPDGLTGVKQLPRLDWTWADNNGKPLKSGEECLPYKREVPAAEVLKYMVGVLEVEYVREEPAADLEQTRRNAAAQSSNMLALSADKARAVVRYHINKIAIEEKLNVFVACRYFRAIGQHSCSANVSRVWAPEKSFSDAIFQPIVKSFTVDKQWTDTRTRIVIQKINDMSEASMRDTADGRRGGARRSSMRLCSGRQVGSVAAAEEKTQNTTGPVVLNGHAVLTPHWGTALLRRVFDMPCPYEGIRIGSESLRSRRLANGGIIRLYE